MRLPFSSARRNKAIGKTPVLVLDNGFVICESTAVQNIPYFDGVLRNQAFIAGSDFSMADITLFASVAFASAIRLPVDARLTALHDWRSRVADLPAVKHRTGQALRREDLEQRPA
jgi:glutathione S-transferase